MLRAWVAAGAPRLEAARVSLDEKVPALAQTALVLPQVTSVAFGPTASSWWSPATRRCARVTMPARRSGVAPLTGLADLVRTVAWSPDGKLDRGRRRHAWCVRRDRAVRCGDRRRAARSTDIATTSTTWRSAPTARGWPVCGYDKLDPRVGHRDRQDRRRLQGAHRGGLRRGLQPRRHAAGVGGRRSIGEDLGCRRRRPAVHDHRSHGRRADAGVPARHAPAGRRRADKRIRVWTIGDTAARVGPQPLAHTAAIIRLAFSGDGRRWRRPPPTVR